jgi:nucleoside 2-deoxyribosyltransferase
MKKTYLAARFPRREEMESYVIAFRGCGYDVTARWVFGGENGLTRSDIALLDLEDVAEADAIVLFTEGYGTHQTGGGRFVEFGYAIALGKELNIIGDRENVFMHHPNINCFSTLDEFLRAKEKIAA